MFLYDLNIIFYFCLEKAYKIKTVLITDSSSKVEYTKVCSITRSKELGKIIL